MPLTFTRTDFRVTRAVLLLAAVLAPIIGVGVPLWQWLTRQPLQWRGEVGDAAPLPEALATALPGAELTWDGSVDVTLHHPDAIDRLVALLPAAAVAALVCGGALILWRLVGRAESGVPFVPESVRSLRLLAVLLAVGGLGIGVLNGVADSRLLGDAVAGHNTVTFMLDFTWLAAAMLVLALAEVFRIGTRLARDVEGLV